VRWSPRFSKSCARCQRRQRRMSCEPSKRGVEAAALFLETWMDRPPARSPRCQPRDPKRQIDLIKRQSSLISTMPKIRAAIAKTVTGITTFACIASRF